MKFRELYMNGEATFEDIFDETNTWNFSDESCTLREYLGLTAEEEDVWISESDEALEELLEKEKATKILFLDMDGTLFNDQKEFTKGNRIAIANALKNGHKVVITTGRPLGNVITLAKDLGLDGKGCYVIAYNGGEIYDPYHKKMIYEKTLPLEHVQYLFDLSSKSNLHCHTYDETGNVITKANSPALKHYLERTGLTAKIVPDIRTALSSEPVKVLIIELEDDTKLIKFREETAAWAKDKVDRMFSCAEYLEHVAPGISKGNALKILCDYLALPLSNTISIGDAENDMTMIEAAALGVAMSNGTAELKKIANYITVADNNHDGVAEVIEKFMR